MKLFQSYRVVPWEPEIIAVDDLDDAVQLIHANQDIDDEVFYTTRDAIELGVEELYDSEVDLEMSEHIVVTQDSLRAVHRYIYPQTRIPNQFRGIPVIVNNHLTPEPTILSKLLARLESEARIASIRDLEDWYWDFGTISPFSVGNNVIGGIILSAVSCFLQGNYLVEVTEGVHYD